MDAERSPSPHLRLTLCQLSGGADTASNLAAAEQALAAASAMSSDLVIFPENVLCRGSHEQIRAASAPLGAWCRRLGEAGRAYGRAVLWGSLPVRRDQHVLATSLLLLPDGRPAAHYDKMHLFRWHSGGTNIDETQLFSPGAQPVTVTLKGWRLVLSVCFDLRFPELYRSSVGDLILCPAEFTRETGQAHWHVLLRARAIENLCYVAGVGQCGSNPGTGVPAFGHSLVVDPWGKVLHEAGEQPKLLHVELSYETLQQRRAQLPALACRRPDVFGAGG